METRKKSEPQMGFEPTTLHDLVGCSTHWATGDWWWARLLSSIDNKDLIGNIIKMTYTAVKSSLFKLPNFLPKISAF